MQLNGYYLLATLFAITGVVFAGFGLNSAYESFYSETRQIVYALRGVALPCAGVISTLVMCLVVLIYISKLQEKK